MHALFFRGAQGSNKIHQNRHKYIKSSLEIGIKIQNMLKYFVDQTSWNYIYVLTIFKMILKLVTYCYRWLRMTCLKEFYQMWLCTKITRVSIFTYFLITSFNWPPLLQFKHIPLPRPSFPETHNKSWLVVLPIHPPQLWFFHVDRLCLLTMS